MDSVLNQHTIHLWSMPLSACKGTIERDLILLEKDELQRANNLKKDIHKERFIAKRANLRRILAGYLAIKPESIRFVYSDLGKPFLQPRMNTENIRFNLSDSQGMAVVAITKSEEIGIDLEYHRQINNLEELAGHVLGPSENKDLLSLPVLQRNRRFLQYWTAKEAYLKYTGQGINQNLHEIEFKFGSHNAIHISSVTGQTMFPRLLSVYQPSIASHVCSIVVEGKSWRISPYSISEDL